MADRPTLRQLLLSILAVWQGLSQKEIAKAAGLSPSRVSQLLSRERDGEIKDGDFERLRAAIHPRPVVERLVSGCLEALEAVEACEDLAEEEVEEVVRAALEAARSMGEGLTGMVRLSRAVTEEGYPEAREVGPARRRAEEQWNRLARLSSEVQSALVRMAAEFQNWGLCERVCAESTRKASRNVGESAALARLAEQIAERINGSEAWRNRLQGYAMAHGVNALRVAGELKAAEAALAEAKRLWHAGSDPVEVLDPGRLLDLEASLRSDQRRFPEALTCLERAAAVGRSSERVMVKKGVTLEKMGDYERAVETFLQAIPLGERKGDQRLRNILDFNLAVNLCHLGRHGEAAELAPRVREIAIEDGDELALIRLTWLDGRIAAGLGRPYEALRLLEEARTKFAAEKMSYDEALALLEEAALQLDLGQTAAVQELARDLVPVFEGKGVHREALAALRVFQEAVAQETATAELARRILGYLFRARHDQSLRFTS